MKIVWALLYYSNQEGMGYVSGLIICFHQVFINNVYNFSFLFHNEGQK